MMNAVAGSKPKKPSADVEVIRDMHAEMREYVESLTNTWDWKRAQRLIPHAVRPKDFADEAFYPNSYNIEPFAMEDLRLAKERNDEAEIARIRTIIRTFSWPSHGRTDAQIASELARAFLLDPLNPFEEAQGELPQLETDQWENVAQITGNMECRGDKVESATRFVENKIAETWKEFLLPYWSVDPGDRPAWPDSRLRTDKDQLPIKKKLTSLRMIRDQLYYQRLYPKLCAFGHAGIKK